MITRFVNSFALVLAASIFLSGCGQEDRDAKPAKRTTEVHSNSHDTPPSLSDDEWYNEQLKEFPALAGVKNKQALRSLVAESKSAQGATLLLLSSDFALVAVDGTIERKERENP